MIILLLIQLIGATQYKYYKYQEIIDIFKELEIKYSSKIKLNYPLNELSHLKNVYCGDKLCEYFYADISYSNATDLPVVLIVAGFHGNEIIGQNVVTELAKYLLETNETDLLGFVKQRRILLYPMVNPYGYYNNVREEMDIDANRDFNYDNNASSCLQTNSARALSHVYEKYLIQMGITFHGGDNSITYSWGSYNHRDQKGMATEAPDDQGFKLLGTIMKQIAYGNQNLLIPPYLFGKMTDLVYAVHGGYEDWAYAGGWDNYTQCVGISKEEIMNISQNSRSLTYLIEAGDQKAPEISTLGNDEAFYESIKQWPPKLYFNSEIIDTSKYMKLGYGHINRNLLASLALIDMAEPYLVLGKNDSHIQIQIGGCKKLDYLSIKDLHNDSIQQNYSDGSGIWDSIHEIKNKIIINQDEQYEQFEIEFSCDRDISNQINPDPKIKPQSYFVRSRSIDNYTEYLNNGQKIKTTKQIKQQFNLTDIIQIEIKQQLIIDDDDILIDKDDSLNDSIRKSYYIWYILALAICFSGVLSVIICKYCQNRELDRQLEMSEFANENRI